jgi:PAS domain-containing protein
VITIPSTDLAFRSQIDRILARAPLDTPEEVQERLRRLFPRTVVRRREISGESAWYIYRDGGWRPPMTTAWWDEPGLPRIEIDRDGWVAHANPPAMSLLGIAPADRGARHFTDFVAPGGLEDSTSLFGAVDEGHELTATTLLRPTSGDVVAIDLHAWREGDRLFGVFRLADDVEISVAASIQPGPASIACVPDTDAAFRGYVNLALERMPEPTQAGLELRLRRLYPHARVTGEGDRWTAHRDRVDDFGAVEPWWELPDLPRVRYDNEALILEANSAAETLLGRQMVGHHWQEFVTPGSSEQVSAMLEILGEAGHAESRFRMPRADGSMLEFDSYTEVDGEGFSTVMRQRE